MSPESFRKKNLDISVSFADLFGWAYSENKYETEQQRMKTNMAGLLFLTACVKQSENYLI